MTFDHRGIGRHPFRPAEFGVLAFAAVLVVVALITAPDAEDAMRAVEAEQSTVSRASYEHERSRRYELRAALDDTTRALTVCRMERSALEARR